MSAAARKGAVRAVDLVPAAFAEEEEDAGAGTLEFDLGHMVAFDAATVTGKQLGQHGPVREAALRKEAASRAQALVAQLWQLPVRKTDVGPMAALPAPIARMPRAKPLPAPKAMTRWEAYAKEKGITKRKRERMIFDEEEQEWRPRYGFKRANDEMREWVIPVKPGTDEMADPFEARANAKKERIVKNKLSHIRNLERAAKVGPQAGIPAQLVAEAPRVAIDVKKTKSRGPRGRSDAAEKVKQKQNLGVKQAKLAVAQLATASIGKFDKVLDGEPARPVDARKRRRTAVEQTSGERKRDADVLRKVLGGSAYGRVDMGSPAGEGGGEDAGAAAKGKGKGKKGKAPRPNAGKGKAQKAGRRAQHVKKGKGKGKQ